MLKCKTCVNQIDGFEDEGPIGGGCDNITRCRVRPVIEEMICKERAHYGNSGNPYGTWLCGQAGIDINSITGDPASEEPVRVYVNDAGEEVAEFRDPAWISIDQYMAARPRMDIVRLTCRVRDHLGNEARHHTGRRYKPKPVAIAVRPTGQGDWLLRRESDISADVQWRAQRGGCPWYSRRPRPDDVVLHAHHTQEPLELDEEDAHYDRQLQVMEQADVPPLMAQGLLTWTAGEMPTPRPEGSREAVLCPA